MFKMRNAVLIVALMAVAVLDISLLFQSVSKRAARQPAAAVQSAPAAAVGPHSVLVSKAALWREFNHVADYHSALEA